MGLYQIMMALESDDANYIERCMNQINEVIERENAVSGKTLGKISFFRAVNGDLNE